MTMFLPERGLWSNERMVPVHQSRLLSSQSRFRRIRHWIVCASSLLSNNFLTDLVSAHSHYRYRPLLDRVDIELPPPPGEVHGKNLTIVSLGGSKLPYVKSVQVNGVYLEKPIITHEQIIEGGVIVFTMSGRIEEWGNDPQVLQALDANVGQLVSAHISSIAKEHKLKVDNHIGSGIG